MNPEVKGLTVEVTSKLQSWLELFVTNLPNLAVAAVVLTLGWFAAKLAQKATQRGLTHTRVDGQITSLLALVVRYAVMIGALMIALGVLNLDKTVTSLLAGVGVVGLALGFAFQDIAANFMSGVMLALRRPFVVGDIIKTHGFLGTVESVNLRSTRLRRFSGELVILPNKDVFGAPIENITESPFRRVDVECGVSYGDDLELVKRLAIEVAEQVEHSVVEQPIDFFYTDFGDSSINFVLRFWINYEQKPFMAARSEAIMKLKAAFDANDIDIPFPIRTLKVGAAVSEPLSVLARSA